MTIPIWLQYIGLFLQAVLIISGIVLISRIKPRSPKNKGEGEQ